MPNGQGEYKTYSQKMHRANKEALYSVIALAIIIVAWLILGVGLSGLDIQIASTPIWIIGGTVGTWLVAVIISVFFAKRVFANFSLDDDPSRIDTDAKTKTDSVSTLNKSATSEDGDVA